MDKALGLSSLDHDVIDVRLHNPSDQIIETLDQTSLVRDPCILQTELHRYVAV
jgi:hypothetical protein